MMNMEKGCCGMKHQWLKPMFTHTMPLDPVAIALGGLNKALYNFTNQDPPRGAQWKPIGSVGCPLDTPWRVLE